MIVEPISSFGTQQATPRFYKKLRALASREGIPFVVDETKTGMGQTGKMWAHEHWWLGESDGGAPDMVTFGGKAGISGFFSTYDYRLNPHCASFEQQVDMTQLLAFGLTWKTAQYENLFELVNDSSSFLKMELGHIQRDYGSIANVRGSGTYIGFDVIDGQAESMMRWLQKRGVVVSQTGEDTLAVRPALVLQPKHAAYLRDSL